MMEPLRTLIDATTIWLAVLAVWLLLINAIAVGLMVLDKSRAREGGRRIPEKILFVVALAGGSPGILASIWLFRHKTRHKSFTWGVPVILLLQAVLIAAMLLF